MVRAMVRSVVVELGLTAAVLRVSYSLYTAYTRVSYSLYTVYTRVSYSLYTVYTRVSYRLLRSNLSVGIKLVTEVNTSHTPDAQPIHSQAVYNDSNVEAEFLCVGVLGRVLGCWDGGLQVPLKERRPGTDLYARAEPPTRTVPKPAATSHH